LTEIVAIAESPTQVGGSRRFFGNVVDSDVEILASLEKWPHALTKLHAHLVTVPRSEVYWDFWVSMDVVHILAPRVERLLLDARWDSPTTRSFTTQVKGKGTHSSPASRESRHYNWACLLQGRQYASRTVHGLLNKSVTAGSFEIIGLWVSLGLGLVLPKKG
jgi:hypothetical protein